MKYLNKLTLRNAPRGALLLEAADALKSVGSGAAAGSTFGPWGAAIGADGAHRQAEQGHRGAAAAEWRACRGLERRGFRPPSCKED